MTLIDHRMYSAENGGFTLSYTYDDTTMTIQQIDAINNTDKTFVMSATRQDNGQNYQFTSDPHTEIHQVMPQGAQTKLGLSLTPEGKLLGVDWGMQSQLA